MKELSIEEKAKAYDEAIERARDVYTYYCDDREQLKKIEFIFPELKESEDERIRKRIIHALHGDVLEMSEIKEAVDWLEKQGEQKPNPVLDIEIPFGAKDSELQEASYYIPEGFHAEVEGNRVVIKRGEQKPTEWKQDNIKELTEFEAAMLHIGESFFGKNHGLNSNDTSVVKEQARLLLELVPKQEWSEEDIEILESCISLMSYNDAAKEETDWLKSLKDRVQPQLKQEWSGHDETMLYIILNDINYAQKNFLDSKLTPYARKVDWLKSLKDRMKGE